MSRGAVTKLALLMYLRFQIYTCLNLYSVSTLPAFADHLGHRERTSELLVAVLEIYL